MVTGTIPTCLISTGVNENKDLNSDTKAVSAPVNLISLITRNLVMDNLICNFLYFWKSIYKVG